MLIFAAMVVGPVTVKPVMSELPPTTPLNVTLPAVADPVVAVNEYGPLIVLANLIGEEVVVIVVLPINETTPLKIAPIELAAPFRVIVPVNQTGVVADVVNDFKLVQSAPSIGKYEALLKLTFRSIDPPVI